MKNKLKIIIPVMATVIAIIIAACVIRFDGNENVDIQSMISTAQKYLVENSYEQAIAEFEAVIDLEPRNVDAYIGIAEAYEALGDIDKAVEWLEKGYELMGDERIRSQLNIIVQEGISMTNENKISEIDESNLIQGTKLSVQSAEDDAENIKTQAIEIINMFNYLPETGEVNSVVYFTQKVDFNCGFWDGIVSRCEYNSDGNIVEARYGYYTDYDMANHLEDYPTIINYAESYWKGYLDESYTIQQGNTLMYSFFGDKSEITEKTDEYYIFKNYYKDYESYTKVFIKDENIELIEDGSMSYSQENSTWTAKGPSGIYYPCTIGVPDGITDDDFFKE